MNRSGRLGLGAGLLAPFVVVIYTLTVDIVVCTMCACVFGPLPKNLHFHNLLVIIGKTGAPDRIRTCDLCLRRKQVYKIRQ